MGVCGCGGIGTFTKLGTAAALTACSAPSYQRHDRTASSHMSFLKKAIGGIESVVRDVSGNKDYHFGDLTKKALGVPTHSDEEKLAAVNDWIVLKDVATGRTYYQNNRLGITQWDPPVPLQSKQQQEHRQQPQQHHASDDLPAGWQTLHDTNGRPYYVNHVSRMSTYERPVSTHSGACFSTQPPPQYAAFSRASAADHSRVLVGAIKVHNALHMSEEEKRAYIGEQAKRSFFGSKKVADGWEEMRDQNGRVFFHNKVTNDVSFVRPTTVAQGASEIGRILAPSSDDMWDGFFSIVEHALD